MEVKNDSYFNKMVQTYKDINIFLEQLDNNKGKFKENIHIKPYFENPQQNPQQNPQIYTMTFNDKEGETKRIIFQLEEESDKSEEQIKEMMLDPSFKIKTFYVEDKNALLQCAADISNERIIYDENRQEIYRVRVDELGNIQSVVSKYIDSDGNYIKGKDKIKNKIIEDIKKNLDLKDKSKEQISELVENELNEKKQQIKEEIKKQKTEKKMKEIEKEIKEKKINQFKKENTDKLKAKGKNDKDINDEAQKFIENKEQKNLIAEEVKKKYVTDNMQELIDMEVDKVDLDQELEKNELNNELEKPGYSMSQRKCGTLITNDTEYDTESDTFIYTCKIQNIQVLVNMLNAHLAKTEQIVYDEQQKIFTFKGDEINFSDYNNENIKKIRTITGYKFYGSTDGIKVIIPKDRVQTEPKDLMTQLPINIIPRDGYNFIVENKNKSDSFELVFTDCPSYSQRVISAQPMRNPKSTSNEKSEMLELCNVSNLLLDGKTNVGKNFLFLQKIFNKLQEIKEQLKNTSNKKKKDYLQNEEKQLQELLNVYDPTGIFSNDSEKKKQNNITTTENSCLQTVSLSFNTTSKIDYINIDTIIKNIEKEKYEMINNNKDKLNDLVQAFNKYLYVKNIVGDMVFSNGKSFQQIIKQNNEIQKLLTKINKEQSEKQSEKITFEGIFDNPTTFMADLLNNKNNMMENMDIVKGLSGKISSAIIEVLPEVTKSILDKDDVQNQLKKYNYTDKNPTLKVQVNTNGIPYLECNFKEKEYLLYMKFGSFQKIQNLTILLGKPGLKAYFKERKKRKELVNAIKSHKEEFTTVINSLDDNVLDKKLKEQLIKYLDNEKNFKKIANKLSQFVITSKTTIEKSIDEKKDITSQILKNLSTNLDKENKKQFEKQSSSLLDALMNVATNINNQRTQNVITSSKTKTQDKSRGQ